MILLATGDEYDVFRHPTDTYSSQVAIEVFHDDRDIEFHTVQEMDGEHVCGWHYETRLQIPEMILDDCM